MRLPKHHNPHLAVDATEVVSRKTLQLQDNTGDDLGHDGEEVTDLHVKLEEIVSKWLKLKRFLASSDESHLSKRRKLLSGEGERKTVERQQHPEPVGEFTSSCSTQASHQIPPKPSVWYRSRYRLVSSTSALNLPRSHCKSPFVTSSPFARSFPHVIVSSVKEPPSEDTEQELEERVSRSALSAVDLEQIKYTFSMVRICCIHANQILDPHAHVRLSR